MRIVLYSEGRKESNQSLFDLPSVGEPLPPDQLGPAHFLVRRILTKDGKHSDSAIRFDSPLRTSNRLPRGGDFQNRGIVRQILSWFSAEREPDFSIVLVDSDGDTKRKAQLSSFVEGLSSRIVIGVAVMEFESWLIADWYCVGQVLQLPLQATPDPEAMAPRKAKETFAGWVSKSSTGKTEIQARIEVAKLCNLETLKKRCRSYEDFASELCNAVSPDDSG